MMCASTETYYYIYVRVYAHVDLCARVLNALKNLSRLPSGSLVQFPAKTCIFFFELFACFPFLPGEDMHFRF